MSKSERRDFYAITIATIDKTIFHPNITGDPNLTKGADGLLLCHRLDKQILSPNFDYFAKIFF